MKQILQKITAGKNTFGKKIISIVMAAALIVSVIDTEAFAATGTYTYNGEAYESIRAVLDTAAKNGAKDISIAMNRDAEITETVNISSETSLTIHAKKTAVMKVSGDIQAFYVSQNAGLSLQNINIVGNRYEKSEEELKKIKANSNYLIYDEGELRLTNSGISHFSQGERAAIKMKNGKLLMDAQSGIREIHTTKRGAAIVSEGSSYVKGGKIEKCSATYGGTGIYSMTENSKLRVDGTKFSENYCVYGSAAIQAETLYLRNSSFEKNNSHYADTSVYIENGEVYNSGFVGEKSTYGHGGIIHANGTEVRMGGISISEGKGYGETHGGLILISRGECTLETGKVYDAAFGDEIELNENMISNNNTDVSPVTVGKGAVLDIKQAKIEQNKANVGGGISNYGTLNLYNVSFFGNTASRKNSYNRNTVTKGSGIYNEGCVNLYAGVNMSDNNIYLCGNSELVIKEDLLFHTENNKLHIALDEQIETEEKKIASFDTENSEGCAYQSVQNRIWYVESAGEKQNEQIAAKDREIYLNTDSISREMTFLNGDNQPVSGVVYEILKTSNGKEISLGYTAASDENGVIQIGGLYDGNYTAKYVSSPTSVEATKQTEKISFKVDTENNKVTSGGYEVPANLGVTLARANPKPVAVITMDKDKAKVNESITFDAGKSTDDEGITSYSWDFGDGTTSSKEKERHSFHKEGKYEVTLTVKDTKGKTSKKTASIRVSGTQDNEFRLAADIRSSTTGKAVTNAVMVAVDSEGNENYVYSDTNGLAEMYVRGGKEYTLYFYAKKYYHKSTNIYVGNEGKEINIYLSDFDTVVGEITAERMSLEEIREAGIDISSEKNQNICRQELTIKFTDDFEKSELARIIRIINSEGRVLKEKVENDSDYKLEKLDDNFYLVINSRATWTKEMFHVQLIVINNSAYEDIVDCRAKINLPEGLSLAEMADGGNGETVVIGDIPKGQSAVHDWYVKGDMEGAYLLGASVTGQQTGGDSGIEPQKFEREYICTTPVVVLGGSALRLNIDAASTTYSGDYYHVTYRLYNNSDIDLYNVTLEVDKGDTAKVVEGGTEQSIDTRDQAMKNAHTVAIECLKPGAYIQVTTTKYISAMMCGEDEVDYYLEDMILRDIDGNASIPTQTMIHFVPGRSRKSTSENRNVDEEQSADPVDMLTGAFTYERSDATVIGKKDFSFTRRYSSSTGTDGAYGYGWRDDFTYFLTEDEQGNIDINFPNGDRAKFAKQSDGSYESAEGSELSLTVNRKTGDITSEITGCVVIKKDGTAYTFNRNLKVTKIVDPDGDAISYGYDSKGRVTKISSSTGSAGISWNSDNRIISISMSSGEKVTYTYDENGFLSGVKNADGDTMRYSYDENGYLTVVTDFMGNESIRNVYDKYGRVTEQYVQGEGTFQFTYDDENNTNTCTGENNYVHTIRYDNFCRITEDIENGKNTYTYDEKSLRIAETDAQGNKTSYEYDSEGNVIKIIYSDRTTEDFVYNENNRLVRYKNRNNSIRSYVYDEKSRLRSITDFNGNETVYSYDASGNVILETHSDGGMRKYSYDAAGRKSVETDEKGNSRAYEYDAAGRTVKIKKSDGSELSYIYSKAGKLLSETDENGNTINYEVNANGYKTSVTDKMEIHPPLHIMRRIRKQVS